DPARVVLVRRVAVEAAAVHAPPHLADVDGAQHARALPGHGGEARLDVSRPEAVGIALGAEPEVAVQGEDARVRHGALPVVERALHVQELRISAGLVRLIVPPAGDARREAVLQRSVEEPGAGRRVVEVQDLDGLVREVIEARLLTRDPEVVRAGVAAFLGGDVDARLHDADEVYALPLELPAQLAARAIGKLPRIPAEFPVPVLSPGLPVEVELKGIEGNVLGPVRADVLEELLLVDAPLAVDEAQGPFRKE